MTIFATVKILMVVTGFIMTPDGLEKSWVHTDTVTPEHCMTMSWVLAGAGSRGAIVVVCRPDEFKNIDFED